MDPRRRRPLPRRLSETPWRSTAHPLAFLWNFGTIGLNLAEIGRDFEQILVMALAFFHFLAALLAGRFGVRGYTFTWFWISFTTS